MNNRRVNVVDFGDIVDTATDDVLNYVHMTRALGMVLVNRDQPQEEVEQ